LFARIENMQLWFWAAVTGMILAGISNFGFKVAAKKGYDAEVFNLYGGIVSVIFASFCLLVVRPEDVNGWGIVVVTILSGFIATTGGIMKVYALRHIDTTIFFPLFKLFSPLLAIIAGIIFFQEAFTLAEWIGILLGLFIPLLLINKTEHTRQQNLVAGLIFVGLVSLASALAAGMNKFAIDTGMSHWVALWYNVFGIVFGTLLIILFQLRSAMVRHLLAHSNKVLIYQATFRAIFISTSTLLIFYAYGHGGGLGIVQTIHSLYIVIPIVLSVLIYQEHINWKKAFAVLLSVLALAFLG
jgi:drug/metabolite transporter (DMT)-like permease